MGKRNFNIGQQYKVASDHPFHPGRVGVFEFMAGIDKTMVIMSDPATSTRDHKDMFVVDPQYIEWGTIQTVKQYKLMWRGDPSSEALQVFAECIDDLRIVNACLCAGYNYIETTLYQWDKTIGNYRLIRKPDDWV